jgi:ATP-dependent protease ClpP protease subunit
MASAALLWVVVQVVAFISRRVPITDHPHAAAALLMIEMLVILPGAVWWGTGVMRSAIRHVGRGGSSLVAFLTGAVGLGAFFWAAAFWWQSARFAMSDVWATLAGDTLPASVQIEPAADRTAAPRLLVSGELEFGTTRAVRAALDANPRIETIRLESRGGRAAEGLALGRLLLDRNTDTMVTGECSSACITAFAGGARRSIARDARLGMHSAGGHGVSAAMLADANRRSDQFIANRGVEVSLLEEGAAVANREIWFPQASVLVRAGLATEVLDVRK